MLLLSTVSMCSMIYGYKVKSIFSSKYDFFFKLKLNVVMFFCFVFFYKKEETIIKNAIISHRTSMQCTSVKTSKFSHGKKESTFIGFYITGHNKSSSNPKKIQPEVSNNPNILHPLLIYLRKIKQKCRSSALKMKYN